MGKQSPSFTQLFDSLAETYTYATQLYKASGHNLRMVQEQLVHSNIQTTTVYSDIMDDDINGALEQLEES